MRVFALFLALVCSLFAAPPTAKPAKPPVGVPADAKLFNGKWYRVYLDKLPWPAARDKCKSLGGDLAMAPDAETWAFVKTLTTASVWLGATDEKKEGVWVWVDGTPMQYADWIGAGPDNAGGVENYLATHKGHWNDVARNGKFETFQVVGFICEWGGR